jgi:hypothetical protein
MVGWLVGTWFLGSLALAGTAYMLGGYGPWPRLAKTVWMLTCVWAVGGLIYYAYARHQARKPSIVYVAPGVWADGSQWHMLVRHFGPNPVYNIELLFVDQDRHKAAAAQSSPLTPDQLSNLDVTLRFAEIDPIEGIWAKQFVWQPLNPDHEHYDVGIVSREGAFSEDLRIERVHEKWYWEMKLTDGKTGRTIVHCRDNGFPEHPRWRLWALPNCFPDYSTKHMGD